MLPRPQQQQQQHTFQPLQRQRLMPQQDQVATGTLPDTNSSVVYEQDGFELFYGVEGAGCEEDGVEASSRVKRDGFDRFYGIKKRDRPISVNQPSPVDASEAAEQRRLCQSPRAAFKVLAPKTVEANTQKQMAEAPTYSVATPALPMPSAIDNVPNGVQFFPVYTPARSPEV